MENLYFHLLKLTLFLFSSQRLQASLPNTLIPTETGEQKPTWF